LIRFINPNYHVILIHYPLALLGLGLIIELFAVLWPTSSIRIAARWMVVLGALATIPAAMSGLFAKYDIVQQIAGGAEGNWRDITVAAKMSAEQWKFLNQHVLFSSIGAGVASLAAIIYMGASPRWPDRISPPLMIMFMAAMGLMTYGAYNAGEAVYRTGFSTRSQVESDRLMSDWKHETKVADPEDKFSRRLEFYVDTLQAHIIGAGMVFALVAAAWGVTCQRSSQLRQPKAEDAPAARPVLARAATVWLLTLVAAVSVTAIGWYYFAHDLQTPLWKVKTVFDSEIYEPYKRDPANNSRTMAHFVLAVSIIVLALVLAPAARYAAGNRLLIGILGLVMIAAVAGQIVVGMLMLYDTDNGPLNRFNPAAPAATMGVAQGDGAGQILSGN